MNNPRKIVLGSLTIFIALVIGIFMYSRVRPYLKGPQVKEINLTEESFQDSYYINIEAQLLHTELVKINTINTLINERGEISHPLALVPGHNIIELELSDGFGKTKVFTYDIITPASEKIYPPVYNEQVLPETPLQEEDNITNE